MRIDIDQRGIVYRRGVGKKRGEYLRMLKPGKHTIPPWQMAEVYGIFDEFIPKRDLSLFLHDQELRDELHVVDVKDNEIAMRFADGLYKGLLAPGKYAFWKGPKPQRFETIDLSKPEIDTSFNRALFLRPDIQKFLSAYTVESFEKGLLFFNREFQKLLEPGDYFFWRGTTSVSVLKADMRRLQLDMTGQEIMTKDKIMLRVNFVSQYRINDPVKALHTVKNFEEQLYILMQLALREYVGAFTLDEILERKESISAQVVTAIQGKAADMGIDLLAAGVKDIILPGDVKDIINQVLIAEKKAQANVIMRREETASTRSLLNTAKIMDENKTLYRLKELEYIERISEKISSITLSSGGQIIDQLRQAFQATMAEQGKKA
ncbi:MAG: slipin family protein [Candidatus Aminicenantes bacterium]|nr:slipin family protein [Candidatus Aminicenantes bacterium]